MPTVGHPRLFGQWTVGLLYGLCRWANSDYWEIAGSCPVIYSYLFLAFTAKKSTFSTISIPWLLTYTKSWSTMTTGWFGVALWLRNPRILTISSPGWWFQFLLQHLSTIWDDDGEASNNKVDLFDHRARGCFLRWRGWGKSLENIPQKFAKGLLNNHWIKYPLVN